MRWLIGIDQRDRSRGAMELAAWLRDHSRTTEPQQVVGVQVIDDHFRGTLSPDARHEIVANARRAIDDAIVAVHVPTPLTEVHVEIGAPVEDVLERWADVIAADALLIGRIGPREVQTVTRLGRVARRLLRALPRAVAVVPPDLRRETLGAGAVLLTTDLGPASIGAARFARQLATSLGRELAIVHVDTIFDHGYPGVGASVHPTLRDVSDWARTLELQPTRVRLVRGDVLDQLLAVAAEEHAPLIVAGSRRLSLSERVFGSSVGTDLARVSERPVIVVPAT